MNIQNVGWTDTSTFDEKMRVAASMPTPEVEPSPDYIKHRDDNRAKHNYSVVVDENLLIVYGGLNVYHDVDELDDGMVIPLPFIRGISPIYECYTKGGGSCVNLQAFSITMAGRGEKIQIYQGEPFVWYGSNSSEDWKKRADYQVDEQAWHKRKLVIQRHEILSAINMYINRVRGMEPVDRQLKLGL